VRNTIDMYSFGPIASRVWGVWSEQSFILFWTYPTHISEFMFIFALRLMKQALEDVLE
jgi:hypothetical protein